MGLSGNSIVVIRCYFCVYNTFYTYINLFYKESLVLITRVREWRREESVVIIVHEPFTICSYTSTGVLTLTNKQVKPLDS